MKFFNRSGEKRDSDPAWEVWLLALLFVTIFGLVAQTKHTPRNAARPTLQTKADVYDIRVPDKASPIEDRLETGR